MKCKTKFAFAPLFFLVVLNLLKVIENYLLLSRHVTVTICMIVFVQVMEIHKDYCDQYSHMHPNLSVQPDVSNISNYNPRQRWQWIEHQHIGEGATLKSDHQDWVPSVLINIGKFMYHIIMHDLKIDVNAMRLNNKHK